MQLRHLPGVRTKGSGRWVRGSGVGEGQDLGFRGSGFRVQGFRVQSSGFRVQGSGFRVQDSGFRVQGVKAQILQNIAQVLGFRV